MNASSQHQPQDFGEICQQPQLARLLYFSPEGLFSSIYSTSSSAVSRTDYSGVFLPSSLALLFGSVRWSSMPGFSLSGPAGLHLFSAAIPFESAC